MEYSKHKEDPYDALREYVQDEEGIHNLMYSLCTIKRDLYDIYEIARWGDSEE